MRSRSQKTIRPEALVKGDPVKLLQNAHKMLGQAEVLRQKREFQRAEKICLELLEKFPDYYGALHTIGLVYADLGKSNLAIVYLVQAAMVHPHSWATMTALAGEYLRVGAKEMAISVLRDALVIDSSRPEVYVTLAEVYYEQRDYVQAVEACKKALEIEPDMIAALQSLTGACSALGRHAEAREALERLIELEKPDIGVLAQYAQLPAPLIRRNLIEDLEHAKSLQDADPKQDEIDAAFVRATALDKMDRHSEAWEWALKANALRWPEVEKETEEDIKNVEHRVDWFEKNLHRYIGKENSDNDYPTSLYILGLSRSGKTTAESIISTQSPIYRGYENPAIQRAITYAYQEGALIVFKSIGQLPLQLYPKVRSHYRRLLDDMMGAKEIFTNTSPGHIWDSPMVFAAIPNTKFVFAKRDRQDMIFRIFMKYYRTGNGYAYNLASIVRYAKAYDRMIDLMVKAFPQNTVVLQYEDMVANPQAALEKMCNLCGMMANPGFLPEVPDDIGCSKPYSEMLGASLDII